MVGWGLLKERLKPAWLLGFQLFILQSFPDLFPGYLTDSLPYSTDNKRLVRVVRNTPRHRLVST